MSSEMINDLITEQDAKIVITEQDAKIVITEQENSIAVTAEYKENSDDGSEEAVTLSDKDLRIIASAISFLIFLVSIIYELSHPSSLWTTVLIFLSIIIFLMIVLSDRD